MAAREPGSGRPAPWAARAVAVVALIVVTITLIAVIGGSGTSDGDGDGDRKGGGGETTKTTPEKPTKKTYVVQPGDSLSGIAARFGLSVEDLITLNMDVDPQALISGTKLKLR